MALLHEELYQALVSAGADEDKARAAARGLGSIDFRLKLLQWMVGVNTAGIMIIIGLALYIIKQLP